MILFMDEHYHLLGINKKFRNFFDLPPSATLESKGMCLCDEFVGAEGFLAPPKRQEWSRAKKLQWLYMTIIQDHKKQLKALLRQKKSGQERIFTLRAAKIPNSVAPHRS